MRAVLLSIVAAAAAALAGPAGAGCTLAKVAEFPITMQGLRPTVPAKINGREATFLLDKGDVNQALSELQAVVTVRPDNFVARFHLGRAHMAQKHYEQASQQFQKERWHRIFA